MTLSIMSVLFIVVSQLSRHALPSASAALPFRTRRPTRNLMPYTHRSRVLVPFSLLQQCESSYTALSIKAGGPSSSPPLLIRRLMFPVSRDG